MADENRAMAAALQGGLLPAPMTTPGDIAAALGSPLTTFHPYHPGDDPMGEIHGQLHAGLDPTMLAIGLMGGPRNLRLLPNPLRSTAPTNIYHDIVDPASAEKLGYMKLNAENPKHLKVEMIDSFKNNNAMVNPTAAGANNIGPGSVRSLINEIKALFPDAEKLSGYRISGAREQAGTKGDATLQLRPSTDPVEPIDDASRAAMNRWRRTVQDFRAQGAESRYQLDNSSPNNNNPNLNRVLNDPATNEITARRNAVRLGNPNWSEVPPGTQAQFREGVSNYGEIPNSAALVVDPVAEQTTRNRWLSAQQGRATRQGNQATQDFITNYNQQMEDLLRGNNAQK